MLQSHHHNVRINGFRIFRLQKKLEKRLPHLFALYLAKSDLEKRVYKVVTFEIANELKKEKFELYDFKIWVIDRITILHTYERIFEFTPGCYLIVKNE